MGGSARVEVGPRRPRPRWIELGFLAGCLLSLAFLLLAAQLSGGVRWFLGLALIAAVSLYAGYRVGRGAKEPVPLAGPPSLAPARAGQLEAFTAMVRRASRGLPYSQVAVSSRARDAFEEHARLARGLSWEDMRRLGRDPARLRVAFHDAILEDFLYVPSADSDARYRWVREAQARRGFAIELTQVLDRMEGWR